MFRYKLRNLESRAFISYCGSCLLFLVVFVQMTGTLVILFVLSAQLAPVLGVLMLSISAIVGERWSFFSHLTF